MTNLSPTPFGTDFLAVAVVANATMAHALCALATAAGCPPSAVFDSGWEQLSSAFAAPLILCDNQGWEALRRAGIDESRSAVVWVAFPGDNPPEPELDHPGLDDFVFVGTDPAEARARFLRAVARKKRAVTEPLQIAFAPGSVERLQPLHGALEALISALEAKDPYTRDHSHRVCATALSLASALVPGDPLFHERLRIAALFHDIGKIGVPEAVLNKPGTLDRDEWVAVQRHVLCGVSILKPVVDPATLAMVRHHHERWDGKGYPDGVAGTDIPLGARIIAVADSWDAMTSARSYRQPMTVDQAESTMRADAGAFDPELLEIFLRKVRSVLAPT